ncbi:MAG TPA: tetratricopeptide repeat protein [Thermoanaerobaculia bacterium]|nr:tetratricopeptide repeat protein [Thermoanaerobaculia bacterium]
MKNRRSLLILLCLLFVVLPLGAQAPDDLRQRFSQAYQKFEAGDYQGVLTLLEPLRKSHPSLPPAILALLGGTYVELGRFKDAQTLLDPVASGAQAGPAILYNAARAALALDQDQKAEGYLKRAIQVAPQSMAARTLGIRYGRQGKVAESYELLRPWVQAHPDDGDARLAAAFCAVELGRLDEAEPLLTGMPEDVPQVRLLRARLLLKRGDPRGTIATLAPLAAAPPKEIDRDLRWVLSEARLQIGEAAGAVALLEGHTGDDAALALLLAQAHQQTGNPEKVLATLKPFVDRMPDPAQAQASERSLHGAIALEYGRALVTGARWAEAVPVLERSTVLDGSNATAWQLYGQALAGAGRREEARNALAKFQELSAAQKKP